MCWVTEQHTIHDNLLNLFSCIAVNTSISNTAICAQALLCTCTTVLKHHRNVWTVPSASKHTFTQLLQVNGICQHEGSLSYSVYESTSYCLIWPEHINELRSLQSLMQSAHSKAKRFPVSLAVSPSGGILNNLVSKCDPAKLAQLQCKAHSGPANMSGSIHTANLFDQVYDCTFRFILRTACSSTTHHSCITNSAKQITIKQAIA